MKQQAIEKIDRELLAFKGGNYENAVKKGVAAALKEFAGQDEEFAQAIVQNDKTLEDCCKHIVKGAGSSLSDHEAYRRAVQFYFQGADVRFQMIIDLCPDQGAVDAQGKKDTKILDLADFLF